MPTADMSAGFTTGRLCSSHSGFGNSVPGSRTGRWLALVAAGNGHTADTGSGLRLSNNLVLCFTIAFTALT